MARSAVLDREVVCPDEDGRPQIRDLLSHRGHPRFIAFAFCGVKVRTRRKPILNHSFHASSASGSLLSSARASRQVGAKERPARPDERNGAVPKDHAGRARGRRAALLRGERAATPPAGRTAAWPTVNDKA